MADTEIATARVRLGRDLATARHAAGLTQGELASIVLYTRSTVANVEVGRQPVGYPFWARADRALDTGGALVRAHAELEALVRASHRRARCDRERNRLARHLAANAEPVRAPDLPLPDPASAEGVEEEDMRRRAMLQALGATGALGALTDPDALDAVRRGLDQSLPDAEAEPTPRDVEDWESLADRYDRGVGAEIPALFLAQVTRDLHELNGVLARVPTDPARSRLLRVASQFAARAAAMTIAAGRAEAAAGWWRTARRAAEHSGDTDLEVFVLSVQAVLTLYGPDGRAVPEVAMALTDRALATAGDRLGSGTAYAYSARAQASALLDRPETAEESLDGLRRVFDRLPGEVTGDRTSWLAFSAYRLHHTESYVYSRLGDLSRAETARAHALAEYPAHRYRGRAQLTLHQATCRVRAGDLRSGVDLATSTLDELPDQARGDRLVRDLTRLTLDAVPADAAGHGTDRDAVHHLRELLAGA